MSVSWRLDLYLNTCVLILAFVLGFGSTAFSLFLLIVRLLHDCWGACDLGIVACVKHKLAFSMRHAQIPVQ